MAEIPIEKKSTNWLAWLLLLLGVIALIWWLIAANDDEPDAVVANDVEQVETVDVVDTGPITDLTMLTSAGALSTMVGRDVNLDGVPVESLEGDMAYYVGTGANSRALVVFNQVPTPNTAKEGEFDINPGTVVNITGKVMSTSNVPEGVSVTFPEGQDAYIFADTMTKVS